MTADARADIVRHAHHLELIAKQVRDAGDVALVYMDEDGAGRIDASLADELWLIAFNLRAAVTR